MNRHPTENDLRAVLDGELPSGRAEQVRAHTAACPGCAAAAQRISGERASTAALLSRLEQPNQTRPAGPAWNRLVERRFASEKEKLTMSNRIFSRRARPAWIALVAVLALGLSLLVPPVRAFATDLLGIFRVQQITILPVNIGSLDQYDDVGHGMEDLLADQVSYQSAGELQKAADADEASQLAGFNVRLPDQQPAHILVQPAVHGELTLNTAQINGILEELGREDSKLDPVLDGRKVIVDTQAAVVSGFGECRAAVENSDPDRDPMDAPMAGGDGCLVLLQTPSPVVETPDELDIPRLATVFFELTGMSPSEAQEFANRIDWATTLVVPVPIQSTSYEEVRVDGVSGSLVREETESSSPEFVLLWVRNGIVYGLTGEGDPQPAIELANNLN